MMLPKSVCYFLLVSNFDQSHAHTSFQSGNIGNALVHNTSIRSLNCGNFLQLATVISMSFVEGNFVTLRLFLFLFCISFP